MKPTNSITLEVSNPALDRIAAALEQLTAILGPAASVPVVSAAPVVEQTPAPLAPPVMEQAPVLPSTAPSYTLDDLMRAGSSLADAGKREAVLQLIAQFGVPALAQLQPDRYGDFAAALRGLGAQL